MDPGAPTVSGVAPEPPAPTTTAPKAVLPQTGILDPFIAPPAPPPPERAVPPPPAPPPATTK